jgi:hypothetical protein
MLAPPLAYRCVTLGNEFTLLGVRVLECKKKIKQGAKV